MRTFDLKPHPELLQGEVFVSNCSREQYFNLNFKTKRIGRQALDGNGKILNSKNWFPVFIGSIELESLQVTLDDLRTELRNPKY